MKPLLAFLVEMAHDPLLAAQFRVEPEGILNKWCMTAAEKDAIRSRDADRIGALFREATRSAI